MLIGLPLAGRIFFELFEDAGSGHAALSGSALALGLGLGVVVLVGLIACTAPTLRARRIAPIDALKSD